MHLNYENPHLSPYDEFQRFKTHPAIRPTFEGGKRLGYGARAINEGGLQSVPKLAFPGRRADRLLRGLRQPAAHQGQPQRDEDRHARRPKSAFAALGAGRAHDELADLADAWRKSWVYEDLYKVRNVKPGLKWGMWLGTAARRPAHVAQRPRAWARSCRGRCATTSPTTRRCCPARRRRASTIPKYDGVVTFDKLSSVFVSNTNHEEDQPVHLQLRDPAIPVKVNLAEYDGPEARYCPAGVYEFVDATRRGGKRLQINAQNCVHCKTCDIKDPLQNIHWVTPEGGGGPNYTSM